MDDAVVKPSRSPDALAYGRPPLRSRRRSSGEVFRSAHVMGWIALSSLVAAIFLSVVIAIARGETTPLYITWISALAMAAVSGVIAAVIVLADRARAARAIDLRADDPD